MSEPRQRRTTDTAASPAHAREASLLAGLLAFVAVYVALHALQAPLFYYVPAARLWTTTPPTDAPVLGYYGLLLPASLAFGVVFAGGRLIPARARDGLARAALCVLPLALLYFVWAELIERM